MQTQRTPMMNEEAIEYLENLQCHAASERECKALEMAISALRSAKKCDQNVTEMQPDCNTPLTLGQLREMDGQPVWIKDLEKPERIGWRLLYWDRGKYLVLLAKSTAGYLLEDYGKTWLAYAYPTHIDREAWQCEYCSGNVDDRPFLDGKDLYISGDGWLTLSDEDHDFCKIEFCPKCGRPLTSEA